MSSMNIPRVGDGATIHYRHDLQAATVVSVRMIDGRLSAWVQEDNAERLDNNGETGPQSYAFTRDPNGYALMFTLRENGAWVDVSEPDDGRRVTFGERIHFWDFTAF